ncbi:MAG: type II toxin-antitoxin system PemK/MazF family toxin [Candidatus Odinarchaeota archaeon]
MKLDKMQPGEIWWVELSISSTDSVGHETKKKRPCIIIVNNPQIHMTTVIPLTSNLNAINIPDTYLIRKNSKNGLKQDSIALIFQLRSLSYNRYENQTGIISDTDLKYIKNLIKNYFNL